MSESRKDVLLKAIEAEVGGASVDPRTLFTDDVVGWSPIATVSGLTDLADLAAVRETAFSNVVIMLRGLDEVGNKAFAEWLIEADHTGPMVLGEDAVLDATGRHVRMAGVTVADFRGEKIRSFRTYFDDVSLIEQIVGV
jgi:ketosteroid isomerase-like protein